MCKNKYFNSLEKIYIYKLNKTVTKINNLF